MLGKLGAGWLGGLAFAGGAGTLVALALPGAHSDRVLVGAFSILAFWIHGVLLAALAPTTRAAWQRVLCAALLSWIGVLLAW